MNIDNIREVNPHIEIKDIYDTAFGMYGRVVDGYDFSGLIEYVRNNVSIGEDGNIYVPSLHELEMLPICKAVRDKLYGEADIEVGYCTGKSFALNGLEYHKGSEINVAVTDMVLLLGRVQDIYDNTYESSKVEAFFVPGGIAVELYASTMHYAPCRASQEGFKVIVILPAGTNKPLECMDKGSGEAGLLFMKNKWLLVHPSRTALIERGAHPGILGDNIQIICP